MKIRQAKKLTHFVCTYSYRDNRVPPYWRRQCKQLDFFADCSIHGDARLVIAVTTTRKWLTRSYYDENNVKKYGV